MSLRDLSRSEALATAAQVSTDKASAAASATAAAGSATEAAASATAAAASAATLTAEIPAFATVALGIAGVADGEQFRVNQGLYDFIYTRQGSAARFDEARATTTAAVAQEAIIAAEKQAFIDAGVPTDGYRVLSCTIPKTGGRMALNVNSNQVFTLNAIESLYPRDADGGTTPTRVVSAVTDPLGNLEAVNIEFASLAHDLDLVQHGETNLLGTNTAVVSMYQYSATSTEAAGIGHTSETAGSYFSNALSASWQQVTGVCALNFNNTGYSIGIIPTAGGTVTFAGDFFGVFVGIDTGTLVVPALADLRAEHMAGHARAAPIAAPSVLTVDGENWCEMGGAYAPNLLLSLGKPALDNYTMDALFEFTNSDAGNTFTHVVGFMNTPETASTGLPNDGQIAMEDGGSRLLYTNPNLADLTSAGQPPVLGNGPMQVDVTLERDPSTTNAECITFLWGVPLVTSTENMPDPFEPEYLTIGGQEYARKRLQSGNRNMKTGDRWKSIGFVDRIRSDEEIAKRNDALRTVLGSSMPQLTSIMGSFDSLTAFSSAPFMQLKDQAALLGGFIPILEAIGGSAYGTGAASGYDTAGRQDFRRRQLQAMARNHDLALWPCNFGRNDLVSGPMDPTDADGWLVGSRTIDAMIAADVASVDEDYRSKIKLILTTIPPAGDWAASDADASDIARETARLAYNDDCRDNYLSRGYDYLLDWEDGSYDGGFASLQAAAIDGYENGDNTIFQGDGIHWSTVGGPGACAATMVPLIQQIQAEVLA